MREKVTRTTLPLIHAWAITVHKSQGLTLDKARISLKTAFEEGEAEGGVMSTLFSKV